MSEAKQAPAPPAEAVKAFEAESQTERRLKYGAAVALTCLVVIALVVAVVYIAERKTKRLDTTAMGLYSLKPQTVNLIKDNKEKIKIISLYTKAKPAKSATAADQPVGESVADQAQVVSDLLEEYKGKGANISVETIDPVASPTKVDDLIAEVTEKYGGEVAKYKAFADTYQPRDKALSDLAEAEYAKFKTLEPLVEKLPDDGDRFYFVGITSTLRGVKSAFQDIEESGRRQLREKPPRYKKLTDNLRERYTNLSEAMGEISDYFQKIKDDKTYPDGYRAYATAAIPRFKEMKTAADAMLSDIKGLGELKLDTLHDALQQKNAILVRGENDWKVLPYEQVWKADQSDLRSQARQGKIRPRFAGEQMITTAILALEHPKKLKVAFVRAGGGPLTEMGTPTIPGFQQGRPAGPFASLARRLEQYNYEVLEKDLTGMYAMMMARETGQPPPPEPSDEEIKDAVWVVLPGSNAPSPGGPPQTIAPKVFEHLSRGGSALVLGMPRGEDMSLALREWGIELHPEALAIHEKIDPSSPTQADMIEDAKMIPVIFEIRDWGASAVTSSMRSLPGILLESIIVKTTKSGAGIKATSIIPIPGEPSFPKAWGETDFESISSKPQFDKEKDFAEPLFAGAVAESDKGGRVVAIGAYEIFNSNVVDFPDQELLKRQRLFVRRFPGNGELFVNSIFWLSHQDPMIAISPAAMEVSRIAEISPAKQKVWRVGVLLIGLPGAVLLAGALVYLSRRD